MATNKNDPRILAAINKAMSWQLSQVGKANSRSVWSIAYPQWTNTGYAWCGGFQVAAFKQAGVDLMKCCWWFYTPYIKNFAQKIGAWKTSGQNYGDNVLFDWSLDGVIDHVGAAYPDPNAASFRSVEGNTSRGTAGSQSNGGGAWVRYRSKPALRGWVDMRAVLAWMIDTGKWKPGAAPVAPDAPHVTQKLTKTDGQYMLDVDGDRRSATNSRWQQVMGTPIDGRIDRPSTCVKATQRWLNHAVASEHIRSLTGKSKLDVDGLLGPATIKVLQFVLFNWYAQAVFGRSINVARDCDGIEGAQTVKLLQHALNNSYANSGKIGAK